jgi:3',5'-cyclic AMP phosphodiesterase CpdA
LIPLKTTARAQTRLNWSKGRVGARSLATCLAAIDALPTGTRALVTCHHPLVETGTRGKALTRGGTRALEALARRGVLAVLSGHVHDAFDIVHPTANGPVRMIGAGTLSQRLRASPAGFNELIVGAQELSVRMRHKSASSFT